MSQNISRIEGLTKSQERYIKRNESLADATKISKRADIVIHIIMILLAFACIFPLLLVLAVSLTDEKVISSMGYRLIPSKLSLDAYSYVLKDASDILRAYGVTLFITVVGSLSSLLVIALYAYPLSRRDFKHRRLFTFLVFFTMLFNGGLVPWYMVYVNVLHIKNTIFAMILPGLFTPLYVLVMRTFFSQAVHPGLIEAAKIDGASEFRIFWQIVLPLSKPALATIGLFNVLFYWNDWYSPLLFITDEKLFNLQYLMYRVDRSITYLVSQSNSLGNVSQLLSNIPSQTARMAMAIIAIGPIIFAYQYFQKYFIAGLTIGGIKG
ncbi:carbohydrate ABC transporter permease [Fusibacter sp. 3D3]|uniref:carbohydrate ABC transporter permease n=1 Tax=Fusibacter sp. 3D3 TaxID=1048380 RepID=UPI000855BF8E|nr:carbohydrate ABC transporter permease [Fusibacter sp. 3D3]GAU77302.1 multiple sugar ABC transporter membrane-spanning permease protein MsmG [Fusibacter sp. 3D3]